MAHVTIQPTRWLQGEILVEGAKNAVLPMMAATLLSDGVSTITNVPATNDVLCMIELLGTLGARAVFDRATATVTVDASALRSGEIPTAIMKRMRASVLAMGPLLARLKKASLGMPGGCPIGARPLDIHLSAFEQMGATVQCTVDTVEARVHQLQGCRIVFNYPSVGATENVLFAAVCAKGKTVIVNAAIEPEVDCVVRALQKMGAVIWYEAPSTIMIEGVPSLAPMNHAVLPDRLEAGTLLLAVAATGGEITIPNAPAGAMELVLKKLREIGCTVTYDVDKPGVTLRSNGKLKATSFKTMPYPGFPTDLQSPMMAVLARAEGTSVITETVFENRMMHVAALQQMGADVSVNGSTATMTGVAQLHGGNVEATDIRAAAALIIAGLVAEGTTTMTGVQHLLRGYQGLDEKLRLLGADVTLVTD